MTSLVVIAFQDLVGLVGHLLDGLPQFLVNRLSAIDDLLAHFLESLLDLVANLFSCVGYSLTQIHRTLAKFFGSLTQNFDPVVQCRRQQANRLTVLGLVVVGL
jgi:hypothetical protein